MHTAPVQLPGRGPQAPGAEARILHRGLKAGYRLREVHHPPSLSPLQRADFLTQLKQLSARSFGVDMEPYWDARRAVLFDQLSYLGVITDPDGAPVGWTSYRSTRLSGRRFLYWDATGVVPEHQRHGLMPRVQGRIYRRAYLAALPAGLWVVYRTRSPVVLLNLRRALGRGNVYPQPNDPVPEDVQRLADEVSAWLGDMPAVDTERLIVPGAYDLLERLYSPDEEPRSKDEEVNAFLSEHLGERDALLVLGRVRLSALMQARR